MTKYLNEFMITSVGGIAFAVLLFVATGPSWGFWLMLGVSLFMFPRALMEPGLRHQLSDIDQETEQHERESDGS